MGNWSAEAPSNIALIKYMGKSGVGNRPSNLSLSYTLNDLKTHVDVEQNDSGEDQWEALDSGGWISPELSEKGRARYLAFWERLKQEFNLSGHYTIRSGNNFPSDCGLASSASSFAALTQAAHQVAVEEKKLEKWSAEDLANLSRQGSGSSCRSFFAPWSYWRPQESDSDQVGALELGCGELTHHVIIVGADKKEISSSEAHKRVKTSLLFAGRVARAESRYEALVKALDQGEWRDAFDLTWADFWDMHALFETSTPSFGYMNSSTLWVLNEVRDCWTIYKDGPLVTMDAGPNVHLLFRKDQESLEKQLVDFLGEMDTQ